MNREFVETPIFTKKWQKMGLNDNDLWELQKSLLANPKLGDVIPGVEGIRKLRIALGVHGKRGGARVIYVDIEVRHVIYLLNVYAKKDQADLTEEEKQILSKYVRLLKEE